MTCGEILKTSHASGTEYRAFPPLEWKVWILGPAVQPPTWCWQTNANQSQLGQYGCPLFRTKTPPLDKSGGAVGFEQGSA